MESGSDDGWGVVAVWVFSWLPRRSQWVRITLFNCPPDLAGGSPRDSCSLETNVGGGWVEARWGSEQMMKTVGRKDDVASRWLGLVYLYVDTHRSSKTHTCTHTLFLSPSLSLSLVLSAGVQMTISVQSQGSSSLTPHPIPPRVHSGRDSERAVWSPYSGTPWRAARRLQQSTALS